MRILLDVTVAMLVVAALAYVSTAAKKYGGVSIWPME
jgi:hypothetical protein